MYMILHQMYLFNFIHFGGAEYRALFQSDERVISEYRLGRKLCGTGCYLKISISNWNILLIYGKISIDNPFSDRRQLSERRVYVKKNRN